MKLTGQFGADLLMCATDITTTNTARTHNIWIFIQSVSQETHCAIWRSADVCEWYNHNQHSKNMNFNLVSQSVRKLTGQFGVDLLVCATDVATTNTTRTYTVWIFIHSFMKLTGQFGADLLMCATDVTTTNTARTHNYMNFHSISQSFRKLTGQFGVDLVVCATDVAQSSNEGHHHGHSHQAADDDEHQTVALFLPLTGTGGCCWRKKEQTLFSGSHSYCSLWRTCIKTVSKESQNFC